MFVYIFIYMNVCVCVCVCIYVYIIDSVRKSEMPGPIEEKLRRITFTGLGYQIKS